MGFGPVPADARTWHGTPNSSAYLSQVRERPKVTQAPLIRSHDLLVIEEHPPGIRGADTRDIVARVYRGDFVRD
jgi:hypothetical protein